MAESTKSYRGKLADPEFRRQRARKAATARTSLDAHIAAIVNGAPALTSQQVDTLRGILAEPATGHREARAA